MSIRQALNERSAVVLGMSLALIVVAVLILARKGSDKFTSAPAGDLAFYSDDEGQTVFTDDAKKLTPFLRDGKVAVRAAVYRCGRSRLIGYLQRHTEYGRRQDNAMEMGTRPTFAPQAIYEVKRPGRDNPWVPVDHKDFTRVLEVMNVSCPDADDTPTVILPGQ